MINGRSENSWKVVKSINVSISQGRIRLEISPHFRFGTCRGGNRSSTLNRVSGYVFEGLYNGDDNEAHQEREREYEKMTKKGTTHERLRNKGWG